MKSIIVLNGPNLNLLGNREPEIYGANTLADIEKLCRKKAVSLNIQVSFFQSNIEGELVNEIQKSKNNLDGIILNAGAYTHTSIAIMDALIATQIPTIEVHISNIYAREEFRHKSLISKHVKGVICGFGLKSYDLALKSLI
mgnify:CR=1 FL=1